MTTGTPELIPTYGEQLSFGSAARPRISYANDNQSPEVAGKQGVRVVRGDEVCSPGYLGPYVPARSPARSPARIRSPTPESEQESEQEQENEQESEQDSGPHACSCGRPETGCRRLLVFSHWSLVT